MIKVIGYDFEVVKNAEVELDISVDSTTIVQFDFHIHQNRTNSERDQP